MLNRYKKIINILAGVFIPFILIFLAEFIQRQSLGDTAIWMCEHLGIVILNYLVIYFVFLGCQTIFNKTIVSYLIVSLLFLSISIISNLKYEIRGEVLLVNDFALVNQAEGLLSFIEPEIFLKVPIITTLIVFIGFLIFLYFLKVKTNRKKVLISFGILSLVTYVSFINQYSSKNILRFFRIRYRY